MYVCTEELSNKEKVYHLTLGDPDSWDTEISKVCQAIIL